MEVSGQLHELAALPPGKEPQEPIGLEAGWAPDSVWTPWRKISCTAGNQTRAVQPVAIPTLKDICFPQNCLEILTTDSHDIQ
jgi:hypothetical protein